MCLERFELSILSASDLNSEVYPQFHHKHKKRLGTNIPSLKTLHPMPNN